MSSIGVKTDVGVFNIYQHIPFHTSINYQYFIFCLCQPRTARRRDPMCRRILSNQISATTSSPRVSHDQVKTTTRC